MFDVADVVARLDQALEAVLYARLTLRPTPPALPVDAVDLALAQQPEYLSAKAAMQVVFERVCELVDDQDLLLGLEETINGLGATCADVGFRCGCALALATHDSGD